MKHMLWAAAVLASASVLSGCISLPPHYDKNPHVKVEYGHVTILPGSENAFFIKKVTQLITKPHMEYYWPLPLLGDWAFGEEAIWTKMYICSTNLTTGERKVVREWPHDLSEPTERGWYVVSGPLHRAAFPVGPLGYDKIVLMNLDTFDWSYIKYPNSPYSRPSAYMAAMSPDEKEFAVPVHTVYISGNGSPHLEGVAICGFEGGLRFVLTEQAPSLVQWPQKTNRIRAMIDLLHEEFIDPVTLSVEKVKYDKQFDMPPWEPLYDQYPPVSINLGKGGDYKGRLSPRKAPTLW